MVVGEGNHAGLCDCDRSHVGERLPKLNVARYDDQTFDPAFVENPGVPLCRPIDVIVHDQIYPRLT